MTSQRLSGTLPGTLWDPPGTPWEAQEAPRATQEGPRSRQERPKSLQKSSGKPLRRPLGPQRPPRSLQGAILEPFWIDFGAIFESFFASGGLICPGFRAHVSDMFASFAHRFPCALCSSVRLLSASLGGRKVPQEPPETAQGDTTERTAQKTTGQHKMDERQRSIAQPSATQNDSREPRSTAQHGTDDLTRTRFPFQRRDRFIKMVRFRMGGAVFSLLGVSWRLLARFWVPLGASAARFEAPGLPRRPPASILGAMFDAFLKIVEGFFVWFSAFLF